MSIKSSINEERNEAVLSVTISKLEDYEEMRVALREIRFYRAFTGKEHLGEIYKGFEENVDILLKEFEAKNSKIIEKSREAISLSARKKSAKSLFPMSILFLLLALTYYLTMDYMDIFSRSLYFFASMSFLIAVIICFSDKKFLKNKTKDIPDDRQ